MSEELTQLPPLTALVGGVASQQPVKPLLQAATKAAPVVLRVKGAKDTTAKVLGALTRRRGKEGAVSNYSRSTQSVLSKVKYVIKLGIRSIDEATGGFPFGKVVEVYGLDASGKSALCMLACGSASQGEIYEILEDGSYKKVDVPFDVTVLYLDNENSLEEGDRLIVYDQEVDCITGECDTIDQIFKDIETVCDTVGAIQAEDEARAKKDKNFIAPLQFVVVVIDTVAGTSTREEVKQEWAKVDYKRQPQQLRDGFRNIIRRLKEYNVCAIFTNQVGDSFKPKMKGMVNKSPLPSEADYVSFGGKALPYYAHLRIWVCKHPNPYKLADGKFPDGHLIHFLIKKNRVRAPLRQGRMVLLFKNAMCQDRTEWTNSIRPQRLADMVEREQAKGNKKFTAEDAGKFYPDDPPGGYSPIWSVLEHLIYMGFIRITASKGYNVNFAKYGISSTASATTSLEDLDTSIDHQDGDIEIPNRLAWPQFYRTYQSEFNVLFDKCVQRMFAQNGVEPGLEVDPDDAEVGENID